MLIEAKEKNAYLSFDTTINSLEGIYKTSFDIFLLLKTKLEPYENLLNEKTIAIEYLKSSTSPNSYYIIRDYNCSSITCVENIPNYTLTFPSNSDITIPKLGNLLMPLVNDLNEASESTTELNNLYNSDACLNCFLR